MKENLNGDKEKIEKLLSRSPLLGLLDLSYIERLPGGVVSQIFAVRTFETIAEELPYSGIVIKHTFENIPEGKVFGHTDFSVRDPAPLTHHTDHEILQLLRETPVQVPIVLWYNQIQRTTVMVDFRDQGYTLMQDMLVSDQLPLSTAKKAGETLALLVKEFIRISDTVPPTEDTEVQVRERLEELYSFLRSDLELYRGIEKKLMSGEYLIPTDTHPKNIAIGRTTNDVMVFDFGRSVPADPQFVAPNFAAHIGLATIGGCFRDIETGVQYIYNFLESYCQRADILTLDEQWFVWYFAGELLHRGLSGRWIDNRLFKNSSLQEVERAVHDIAIEVFRPERGVPIRTVENLLQVVQLAADAVREGRYKSYFHL